MTVNLPVSKYSEPRRRAEFWRQILERTALIPSVDSVAAVFALPSSNNWDTEDFSIEGQPPTAPGQKVSSDYQSISPGYFKALRIPLTAGREFSENDGETSPPVVIINEWMAHHYWPGQNPIGKRIKFDSLKSLDHWLTIVGVVGDVKTFFFDKTPRFTMYVPFQQSPDSNMSLVLRSPGNQPMNLVAAVRAQLARIDPDQPIYDIAPMELTKLMSSMLEGVIKLEPIVFVGLAAVLASAALLSGYLPARRATKVDPMVALRHE